MHLFICLFVIEIFFFGIDTDNIYYFREKQSIAKSSRKLEKRVKELLLQLDDERRHADQYKEQVRFKIKYVY